MFSLILKDLRVQKKMIWMVAAFLILLSIYWSGPGGIIAGITGATYVLTLGASAIDDRNRADIILNSLPVSRAKIVITKYVTVYLFALGCLPILGLLHLLARISGAPSFILPFSPVYYLMAFVVVTVLASINLPLIFKYGYVKSRPVSLLLYMGILFGGTAWFGDPDTVGWLIDTFRISEGGAVWEVILLSVGAMLLLLACSIGLSIRFYRNREF